MKISILTLFPEMITGVFQYSIINRAIKQGLLEINAVNLRNFGLGKYKQVDDRPYGGGVGMIMRVDVIAKALEFIRHSELGSESVSDRMPKQVRHDALKQRIILLDPKGKTFNQQTARRFSKLDHLILICGHYEGVDHRVVKLVDETISIGDYILTGGEIATMVIIDSVTRLLPGVLKNPEATLQESFSIPDTKYQILNTNLEYPQYTRPEEFQGLKVPKVLLSGNHKKIEEWKELSIEISPVFRRKRQ